ncbi:MAG: DUF4845 domain-containing protein [Chromatiales bacterium]
MSTLSRQRGLSIWELLFYSVLIGIAALVIIKVFPLYMEKFKVVKSMKVITAAIDARQIDEFEIKNRLLKHFEIEDVDRFSTPDDLKKVFKVTKNKENPNRTMSMVYEIRAPFVADLDLVLKVNEHMDLPPYAPL